MYIYEIYYIYIFFYLSLSLCDKSSEKIGAGSMEREALQSSGGSGMEFLRVSLCDFVRASHAF